VKMNLSTGSVIESKEIDQQFIATVMLVGAIRESEPDMDKVEAMAHTYVRMACKLQRERIVRPTKEIEDGKH